MYILTDVEKINPRGLTISICLHRLGDIKRHKVKDGVVYEVYRSKADKDRGKVHGIYVVKDGALVRDKRRTALQHIRQLFWEDTHATAQA